MAIKASDIKGQESLTEWLAGQPDGISSAIAIRVSLRVLPIALSINKRITTTSPREIELEVTLRAFQVSFLTWMKQKYRIPNQIKNASNNTDIIIYAANRANSAAGVARNYPPAAAALASAGLAANSHIFYQDKIYVVETVEATTRSISFYTAGKNILPSIRADVEWLESHPDDINALIDQPLWLDPSEVPGGYDELQIVLKSEFDTFRQSDLAQDTSFGLIADWYAALLPEKGKPRSLFGEKKDLELATQPKAFWDGEAQEVMDRVAELVGWPEDYRKQDDQYEDTRNEGEALVLEEDKKDYQDGRTKSEIFPKTDAKKISANRTIFRFQLTAIVNSSAIELKNFGDQPNEKEAQEDWLKKKKFLENIHKLAIDALELLPIEPDGTRNEKDDEVASLLSDYAQEFDQALRNKKSEVVDWVINLGSAAGLIGLVSLAGGFMPIATPIILRLTCGDKVMDVLRVFKSSSKKKPKDKDE